MHAFKPFTLQSSVIMVVRSVNGKVIFLSIVTTRVELYVTRSCSGFRNKLHNSAGRYTVRLFHVYKLTLTHTVGVQTHTNTVVSLISFCLALLFSILKHLQQAVDYPLSRGLPLRTAQVKKLDFTHRAIKNNLRFFLKPSGEAPHPTSPHHPPLSCQTQQNRYRSGAGR